ncbi:unnamed protein product, partial [Amoebophrya sp. A120]
QNLSKDRGNREGPRTRSITAPDCGLHRDRYVTFSDSMKFLTENAGLAAPAKVLTRKNVWEVVDDRTGSSSVVTTKESSPRGDERDAIIRHIEAKQPTQLTEQAASTPASSAAKLLLQHLIPERLRDIHRLSYVTWDGMLVGELGIFRIWQEDYVFPRGRWFVNELSSRFARRHSCHGGTVVMLVVAYHTFLLDLQFAHAANILLELAEYLLLRPESV